MHVDAEVLLTRETQTVEVVKKGLAAVRGREYAVGRFSNRDRFEVRARIDHCGMVDHTRGHAGDSRGNGDVAGEARRRDGRRRLPNGVGGVERWTARSG